MRAVLHSRNGASWHGLLGLALLVGPVRAITSQESRDTSSAARVARGEALRLADPFPPVAGEALSGRRIALPDSTSSRYTLVVFSFSKAGGNDAGQWNERLANDASFHDHVEVVIVAELEGAPRLVRGMIKRGLRKGLPPSVNDQTLVLDRDGALWKRRLAVTGTDRSYVVLIAPDGRIRWMSDGACDEARFTQLRQALL